MAPSRAVDGDSLGDALMRILLAPSAFAPHRGGVEELTLKLGQALQRRGHEVAVVTVRHPRSLPETDIVEGVRVVRLALSAPGRHPRRMVEHLSTQRAASRRLDALAAPDVVHLICASIHLPAVAAYARRVDAPLVITTQGETAMDADGLYQRSRWMRGVLRRESSRAAALTACSRWTAEHAASIAPAFAGADVVLNGVDPDDWSAVTAPPDEPVVVAWGRHVPQKGFDLLLAAFDLLREEVPQAQLVLGGDGPEHERLLSLAGPGVTLIGRLDRTGVRDLLAKARVVAVPSRIEPFGIVAVEALAAGRGLVWSNRGGLREASGGLGHGVDPFDAAALATALRDELAHPVPPEVGRAHAAGLSWDALASQYEVIYLSRLQRRTPR